MVRIRQHGTQGELFDVAAFLADVDRFVAPDAWRIAVDECLGDRAPEIEQIAATTKLSDSEFRALYNGIHQTIDGRFAGFRTDELLCELVAVDSSYWEISGPGEFEAHMLKTYGAWSPTP